MEFTKEKQSMQQQQKHREQDLKTRLQKLRCKQLRKPFICNFAPYASLT